MSGCWSRQLPCCELRNFRILLVGTTNWKTCGSEVKTKLKPAPSSSRKAEHQQKTSKDIWEMKFTYTLEQQKFRVSTRTSQVGSCGTLESWTVGSGKIYLKHCITLYNELWKDMWFQLWKRYDLEVWNRAIIGPEHVWGRYLKGCCARWGDYFGRWWNDL